MASPFPSLNRLAPCAPDARRCSCCGRPVPVHKMELDPCSSAIPTAARSICGQFDTALARKPPWRPPDIGKPRDRALRICLVDQWSPAVGTRSNQGLCLVRGRPIPWRISVIIPGPSEQSGPTRPGCGSDALTLAPQSAAGLWSSPSTVGHGRLASGKGGMAGPRGGPFHPS